MKNYLFIITLFFSGFMLAQEPVVFEYSKFRMFENEKWSDWQALNTTATFYKENNSLKLTLDMEGVVVPYDITSDMEEGSDENGENMTFTMSMKGKFNYTVMVYEDFLIYGKNQGDSLVDITQLSK